MENGLDNLLVPSLRKSIEENLGKETLHKIEQRLMERHGLGLIQAIKNFNKFDSVLREFFGAGADGLEEKFLKNIIDESLIIAKILEKCQIPQTSGYRKINFMINSGLLVANGHELSQDGKKIKKYETIFNNVKVDIVKNNIAIKIQLKHSLLVESSIFQTILLNS